MLLLHQTGSVKVGEVVRYTLTYTPSLDRILPPPRQLFVKIKNTNAIPLRAAYLHGPYTLYVSTYPSTFDPNTKHAAADQEGAPDFEPQLKAGGQWTSKLTVPEETRNDATRNSIDQARRNGVQVERKSFTWIIEVASQVLFSTSAAVNYELLVGRDENSVELGFHGVIGSGHGAPGKLEDFQRRGPANAGHTKGVFSKAVRLEVEDTESLWSTPPFPGMGNEEGEGAEDVKGPAKQPGPRDEKEDKDSADGGSSTPADQKKKKKIHLVLLTHGLHSNLGADMLYLKESIDAAAKQAREDARKRRAEMRKNTVTESNDFGRGALDQRAKSAPDLAVTGTHDEDDGEDSDEEEEVLVRGFSGNAVKTERGIQYLGKRFAKYVLSLTYPDQPYLPVKSSISKSITRSFTSSKTDSSKSAEPTHKNSSIVRDQNHRDHNLPYQITSISFIGHSLGGLVQTYAIAYIQKHSPEFFNLIKPVNFVALATPFLGLSNENPIYVKFGLDFGLVGRTGQDLGLTWRAPTLAKSGWGAVIGGLTSEAQKAQREPDPGAKPLLRILPTGPAHAALKNFRNRTVYSNVVNDGIVPLRTSCLLFLDWRGLGRVDKARRENGLVGTMVGWGWAELTGQNASAPRKPFPFSDLFSDSGDDVTNTGKLPPDAESSVPQADASQGFDFEQSSGPPKAYLERTESGVPSGDTQVSMPSSPTSSQQAAGLWQGFLSIFKPQAGAPKSPPKSPRKSQKIYKRGQTMHHHHGYHTDTSPEGSRATSRGASPEHFPDDATEAESSRRGLVRGSSLYTNNSENGDVEAPPQTTFFESAGDLIAPPLPPKDFILDPAARPRTIFHDRVYHPDDIPPPPTKRQRSLVPKRVMSFYESDSAKLTAPSETSVGALLDSRRAPSQSSTTSSQQSGTMRIEEKIARAYHKDLSWRKVLVRLEPDAHNNMIVRRMFANAYGWPVVKHLCDTHFAYTMAARTRDEEEGNEERVKSYVEDGAEEVIGQTEPPMEAKETCRTEEEMRSKTTDDVFTTGSPSRPFAPQMESKHQTSEKEASSSQNVGDVIQTAPPRTASEVQESRDEVADMVSRISASGETGYSSLSSSQAALKRLARQDSARWSDHFFEGSDEGDDDDYLERELSAARKRGGDDEPKIATKLTISPESTRLNLLSQDSDTGKAILLQGSDVLASPTEIVPSFISTGVSTPRETREREEEEMDAASRTVTSTSAGVGLSLGEGIPERQKRESLSSPTGGVAEQVAHATAASLDGWKRPD